ncbi:MAG: hypothetical protein AB3N16_13945 [Flavobacteriaceae bacterium]
MKDVLLLCLLFLSLFYAKGQESVDIDGRLRPILTEFFNYCDHYGIDYHEKLFQLKSIDITNTLSLEEGNTVLGKVVRDSYGDIEHILVNWAATIDQEILRVVAFHEFAHHFLDYKHTCQDCNEIMAVNNSSYFNVVRDWDNQVHKLFITSPVYQAKQTKISYIDVPNQ